MIKAEIHTLRLRIVPFDEQHLTEDYVSWLNNKDLMRYSEQRHIKHDLNTCRAYLASFTGSPNYFWAIESVVEPSGMIGTLTAYIDPHNGLADIGILIAPDWARGCGLAYEAWIAVMEWLKDNLNIRKITAGTMSVNTSMLHIMKKSGMINDGRWIKHFIFEGKPVDIIYMAWFDEQPLSDIVDAVRE